MINESVGVRAAYTQKEIEVQIDAIRKKYGCSIAIEEDFDAALQSRPERGKGDEYVCRTEFSFAGSEWKPDRRQAK